jgi:hypothetical protein
MRRMTQGIPVVLCAVSSRGHSAEWTRDRMEMASYTTGRGALSRDEMTLARRQCSLLCMQRSITLGVMRVVCEARD